MNLPPHVRLQRLIDLQRKLVFADQVLVGTMSWSEPQEEIQEDDGSTQREETSPYDYESLQLGDIRILMDAVNNEINRMKL